MTTDLEKQKLLNESIVGVLNESKTTRFFKQLKKDSKVHHWKWTKSGGVFVALHKNGSYGKYEKSDYTLKELLDKSNGESPHEVNSI